MGASLSRREIEVLTHVALGETSSSRSVWRFVTKSVLPFHFDPFYFGAAALGLTFVMFAANVTYAFRGPQRSEVLRFLARWQIYLDTTGTVDDIDHTEPSDIHGQVVRFMTSIRSAANSKSSDPVVQLREAEVAIDRPAGRGRQRERRQCKACRQPTNPHRSPPDPLRG